MFVQLNHLDFMQHVSQWKVEELEGYSTRFCFSEGLNHSTVSAVLQFEFTHSTSFTDLLPFAESVKIMCKDLCCELCHGQPHSRLTNRNFDTHMNNWATVTSFIVTC